MPQASSESYRPLPDAMLAGQPLGGMPLLWRFLLVVPLIGFTVLAVRWGVDIVQADGPPGVLDWLLLASFLVTFVLVGLTSWGTLLGFLVGRGRAVLDHQVASLSLDPSGRTRTALLMPIYGEEPARVFAALQVMGRALGAMRGGQDLDIVVLSDTRDATIAEAELAAYAKASASLRPGEPRLYYRRRASNLRRKAGNIADFCTRWGRGYDHMIVLDADSLMTARAVRRLIALMEANPRVGLIQSVPYPVGRQSLFARILQFSARLYTPAIVRGLDAWQAGDGNYWGHNAILRVAAFMEHCDLPVLPGRPPLGGEILCHDVVEGALMRRGGWEVRLVPDLEGSYEEMPTNLIDFLHRERRWCEGNLQHARVLFADGLSAVSRMHLGLGVLAYAFAPISLLTLALSAVPLAWGDRTGLDLLTLGLFRPEGPSWLAALWYGLTLVPRFLSVAVVLADAPLRRAVGGTGPVLASAALEYALSSLMMASASLVYGGFVLQVMTGRPIGWHPQARDDRPVGFAEAWSVLRGPALIGVAWGAASVVLDPLLAVWTLPMTLGLVLGAPFAVLTSRTDLGRWAQRLGVFLIPEETTPPDEVAALEPTRAALAAAPVPVGIVPMMPVPHPSAMQPQTLRRDRPVRGRPTRDPSRELARTGLRLEGAGPERPHDGPPGPERPPGQLRG